MTLSHLTKKYGVHSILSATTLTACRAEGYIQVTRATPEEAEKALKKELRKQ